VSIIKLAIASESGLLCKIGMIVAVSKAADLSILPLARCGHL